MNESGLYEGILEIISISNIGMGNELIGTPKGRFVRYPGAQQLSVWLPENGSEGYGMVKIYETSTNTVLLEEKVADCINGSILLGWKTINWPPESYQMDIEHPKGGLHRLCFNKLAENEVVPKEKIVEMPVASADWPSLAVSLLPPPVEKSTELEDTMWKVYKDGLGNPIPDEDQLIQDKALNMLDKAFNGSSLPGSPSVVYENEGRVGYLSYLEGTIRIRLWHEIGGGDCKWYINIPSEEEWEAATKTPLNRRREILLFIASAARRDMASGWRYEIREREIAFF